MWRRHGRLNMATKCLLHCVYSVGDAEPLTNFSDLSFKRFLEFRKQWLGLNGHQKEAAARTTEIIAIETEEVDDCYKYAYHRKCYSSFSNIALVKRAEVRCKKAKEAQDSSESSDSESECKNPIPKKRLRSSFNAPTSIAVSKNEHVLPPISIICKKEKAYYNDSVSSWLMVFF